MEHLEQLPGGYTLSTEGAYPLSTDSMCLAAFAPLGKNWRIADLGSGSGALGLLLCAREESCSLESLFEAAAWCLPTGGRFCLSYRIEGLADLCWQARKHDLEPKRLCLVRHKAETPPAFLLLECRRGGKPQLSLEELILYGPDGRPTPQMREIYHL